MRRRRFAAEGGCPAANLLLMLIAPAFSTVARSQA
jgi:hypothetical protein